MRFVCDNLRQFIAGFSDLKVMYDYLELASKIQKENEDSNSGMYSNDLAFANRLTYLRELIIQGQLEHAVMEAKLLVPIVIRWVSYDYTTRFYGDMS